MTEERFEIEMPGADIYLYASDYHSDTHRTNYQFLVRYPKITLDRVVDQRRPSRRHRNWSTEVTFDRRAHGKGKNMAPYIHRWLLVEVRKFLQQRMDFDETVKVGE